MVQGHGRNGGAFCKRIRGISHRVSDEASVETFRNDATQNAETNKPHSPDNNSRFIIKLVINL